jgi:hypothetical protein
MAQENYLILTCDGGGIRGLIPALLVQRLLSLDPDFLTRVDLFAGTSTGGVIALGLASEVPISNIVNIYRNRCGEIFAPFDPIFLATSAAPQPEFTDMNLQAAALMSSLWHVKYGDDGLKTLISETYPTAATKLSGLQRRVLVTALDLYDVTERKWVPTCLTNLPGSKTADISVLDAALSTSAAPIYFPPHVMVQNGMRRAFADGGIFANNPSMLAAASVIASGTLAPLGLTFKNIKLLSIGTGFTRNGIPNIGTPESYGVLAWLSPWKSDPTPAFPLLSALMDSVSDTDSFQCQHILGDNFRRASVQLTQSIDLDDCRMVGALESITNEYMDSVEWREITQWVRRDFVTSH